MWEGPLRPDPFVAAFFLIGAQRSADAGAQLWGAVAAAEENHDAAIELSSVRRGAKRCTRGACAPRNNLFRWLKVSSDAALSAMTDPLDYTGKVVLVTGSSRGIGAEMIRAFGARGAQCVVNFISDPEGKNKADAENVAGDLKDPLVVDCDVTQPSQVEAMMKKIADKFSGFDILVNNSGIIRDRTIKKLTFEEFESVVRVNLAGTFNVTQKAAGVLRNGGRIINLSSVSGQMGLFGQAN
jgi:hypothetical protein